MSAVIKVENLSKQYRLGQVGTGTITHDVNRWWHKIRGKEDPYLKIGESNDRTIKGESDYVWALKDINFEVQQGEVLGIIGRNGAGKSTLLKILSRTTAPTMGSVKIKGRVASLLEVGTGFHPELSGRDNIFLNGAILGMTRREIQSKFDEIVDFAGVERYVDTPVKRYSSGMYVRLAFAVAAHLEPEILIVDEVLAVGDAEFQKKALGKMKDVSRKDGRTVLFVSHNMAAMKNLCQRGIYLVNGNIQIDATIDTSIDKYFTEETAVILEDRESLLDKRECAFLTWKILESEDGRSIKSRSEVTLIVTFKNKQHIDQAELGLILRDHKGDIIFSCNSRDCGGDYINIDSGLHEFQFRFRLPIKHGPYEIDIAIVSKATIIDQWIPSNKLTVLSDFKSHLPDNWLGIVNEPIHFYHDHIFEK